MHLIDVGCFTNVLMVALDEKSEDHKSQWDSSSGEHERLNKISQQSIQKFLRYLSLEQSGGPADLDIPRASSSPFILLWW